MEGFKAKLFIIKDGNYTKLSEVELDEYPIKDTWIIYNDIKYKIKEVRGDRKLFQIDLYSKDIQKIIW